MRFIAAWRVALSFGHDPEICSIILQISVKFVEFCANFSYFVYMTYYKRLLEHKLARTLARGKSALLLGPRQTGKTTFIKAQCQYDLYYNFLVKGTRLRFEQNPDALIQEVSACKLNKGAIPLIVIDEIQKVPDIVDAVQYLIDEKQAQFILTGSSARKLGGEKVRNLLPGRIVKLHLDPLCLAELPQIPDIHSLLVFGSLPHIFLEAENENKESDLLSYVETYLEEEIRVEARVRNLGTFVKFLQYAAIETGTTLNISKLSQDIGASRNKISDYYQILEDCMIVDRVTPITRDHSRRRLTKSDKHLFFDLGVRRVCANEGLQLPDSIMGNLFEQFIGMELQRMIRLHNPALQLKYWRDHAGPEIDYVVDLQGRYCPIEVKWTELPKENHCRHLLTFMDEYATTEYGYVICRAPKKMLLHKKILAIPWQELYGTILPVLQG